MWLKDAGNIVPSTWPRGVAASRFFHTASGGCGSVESAMSNAA
jgi:hypothetical protein